LTVILPQINNQLQLDKRLMACLAAVAVFAQEETAEEAAQAPAPKEKKNSAALDAFQLFKGFIASDADMDFHTCGRLREAYRAALQHGHGRRGALLSAVGEL
jgi:hypothetical protein